MNVNLKPLWATETFGALPLARATEPASVVTVTLTLLPGLIRADPGLTDEIWASADPVPTRTAAMKAPTSTIQRTAAGLIPLSARYLADRTTAPNESDNRRRIRHSGGTACL